VVRPGPRTASRARTCTITALVIIVTGSWDPGVDPGQGVSLTSSAFESEISWFPWVLTLAVVLFAYSTMISWSYYGLKAWTYLFGESLVTDFIYKALFLAFVIIGSSMQLGAVIDFSDAMIFAMAFPNIIGMALIAGKVKGMTDDYIGRLKNGTMQPER